MADKPLKSIKFPGLTDTYTIPQIDTTLTIAGKVADAKATGDEISQIKEDLHTVDLVDRTAILFGYLNSTGGEVYSNPAGVNHEIMTDFIPVTAGNDYTMFWWGTLGGGYWHRLCWYDSAKSYINNSTYSLNQQTSGYFYKITDYTAPSNAAYVRVSTRSYDDGVFSFYTGRIKHAEKPNWYDFVNAPHVTDSANVKSINHAGYSGTDGAPENTIPAFVQSKAHGFDFIECDTAVTSDGVVVCIHDNTIDRTSDGTGNVRDLTYQQLLQYDFGSWKSAEYAGTKIPTLEEVLDVCKALRLHPYIEIKYNGSFTRAEVEQIVDLVRSKCMLDSVTFISFSSQQLGWVMSAYKYARLGLLTNTAGDSTVNFTDWAQIRRILQILRNGCNSVFADVRKETIDPTHTSYIEGINKVYSYNFPVECWTVYDTRFWFGRVDKCVNGFTTVTYKYDDWAYDQKGIETLETSVEKLQSDVTTVNNLIDSAFITDTASGAAAHFVDGADNVPLKSLKVNIVPVQSGSGDPSPDNVRPISGWNAVKVTRAGKNLIQCPTSGGRTNSGITWTYNSDGSVTASGTATGNSWSYGTQPSVMLSQGTYTVSVTSPFGLVVQNLTDGGYFYNGDNSKVTFTIEKQTEVSACARVANGSTINGTTGIQIEVGSEAIEFEPYNGNVYEVSLSDAGNVYGGTLDVVSGELNVTHGYIASYSGQELPSAWISDRDVYTEGARPTTGAQVVYQLATPLTYQLSATEIKSLLGINNVWSDAGDIECEYRADTKLYIDKRLVV